MKVKMKFNLSGIRSVSWCLLLIMTADIILPLFSSVAYAGGPTQPEVQSFTPISVTDMVDPFTGDFRYNIPLMDIEGYPVNLTYNSGVSMEQEASWVGLGWTLNTGAIVRNMRGLPDDFNGDHVVKEINQKPSISIDVSAATANMEFYGKPNPTDSVHLNGSVSLGYNNYTGYNAAYSISPSFVFAKKNGQRGDWGFNFGGSSENGMSWGGNFSFGHKLELTDKISAQTTVSTSLGGNTRGGLEYFSFGLTRQRELKDKTKSVNVALSPNTEFNPGLHSYAPTTGPSMKGFAVSLSWKLPVEAFGLARGLQITGSFSKQWIPDDLKTIVSPAYGFFHLEKGQRNEEALLDFNRDNDGTFTKFTPFLPSAHLTADLFSVQAQGIDGSFRGFRHEVGYVFDPKTKVTSNNGGAGLELGPGSVFKLGIDVSYSHITSQSGAWDGPLNNARDRVIFHTPGSGVEAYALQDASEMSVETDEIFTDNFRMRPVFFPLGGIAALPVLRSRTAQTLSSSENAINGNGRVGRLKRNKALYFRTIEEVKNGMGVSPHSPLVTGAAKNHHIGEITEITTDGRRYVFGLPVYNTSQEDVTFAVGDGLNDADGLQGGDNYTGLIDYNGSAELTSLNNKKGIDNYYSSVTTPPYAHSFMLTSILSDDYSDSDTIQGPSPDDLGTYVKLDYKSVPNYKWRAPMNENRAYYNRGLATDRTDDKASFIAGTKDLMYVQKVETKNYIAIFESVPDRPDGSSLSRHGVPSTNARMHKLVKISLYSRPDYNANGQSATPIQQVHFVYYDQAGALCPGYPIGNRKLTLKEVYFTYRNSAKMRRSSYKFTYGFNPSYNMRNVDRWGNYQNQAMEPNGLTSMDFPYTRQNASETNLNASAWLLSQIELPSGGVINVDYESDDYAYVQNKPAMRMMPIMGSDVADDNDKIPDGSSDVRLSDVIIAGNTNRAIYFKPLEGYPDLSDYVSKNQQIYFRCLVYFDFEAGEDHEYISGYGKVKSVKEEIINGVRYGRIEFYGDHLIDLPGENGAFSPITKAAIQYGRLHMSRYIFDPQISPPAGQLAQNILDFGNAVIGALASFRELFRGPNLTLWKRDIGRKITTRASYIRLQDPTGHKLGGGSRVKRIMTHDNWDEMAGNGHQSRSYGQTFSYVKEDGTSSGVASYEPQVGGDENPWRTAVEYANKKRFSPDDNLYIETPLMESQFPSPQVGYSRVVIEDVGNANFHRTSTGKVVKEFYTARDYPTSIEQTDVDLKTMNSFLPFGPKYQYLTASQGFSIELNDMHGKPKSEAVYASGATSPLSRVDYFYKTGTTSNGIVTVSHLDNNVTVIDEAGNSRTAEIGVRREGVADFRQSQTLVVGGKAEFNIDILPAAPIISIASIYPTLDLSNNKFSSATMNKVTNRFGILDRVVANQDGSIVETKNLAYDEETGEVLLTQTTTNFNDAVYSMNFPAYWTYKQVSGAYRNINYTTKLVSSSGLGVYTIGDANNPAGDYLYAGDEVQVKTNTSPETFTKGWIISKTSNTVKIVDKAGDPVVVSDAALADELVEMTVIRSGYRNKQAASMANITLLTNPLENFAFQTSAYSNVLNAGAVEFGENWRTYCDCFDPKSRMYSSNPYVLGTKGNWRPVKSLTYLTTRSQSSYKDNTNIRRDGVFNAFTPYYSRVKGRWFTTPGGWTFVSEVTEFSPNGMPLETRDALGRYSASLFGFNNTLTTAVAANSRLRQLEFASFEDNQYSNCADQQLFSGSNLNVVNTTSHTGYKSLFVKGKGAATFGVDNDYCAPANSCNLQLQLNGNNLSIMNGTGPYTLETQLLAGSGTASIEPGDVIGIRYNTDRNFEIIITIRDSRGCVATYKYKRLLGTAESQIEPQ